MNPELNPDVLFSKKVLEILEIKKIDQLVLGVLLDLKPASISDLFAGKATWKLKHVVKIARFLGEKIDLLVFGDEDFILKESIYGDIEMRNYVKGKLIKGKKYKQLGQLEANGFFGFSVKVAEPRMFYGGEGTKIKKGKIKE